MQISRFTVYGLTIVALLLSMAATRATAQSEKLVGTWKVTLEANSGGGAAAQGDCVASAGTGESVHPLR